MAEDLAQFGICCTKENLEKLKFGLENVTPKDICNWIMNDLTGMENKCKEFSMLRIRPEVLFTTIAFVKAGLYTRKQAREYLRQQGLEAPIVK